MAQGAAKMSAKSRKDNNPDRELDIGIGVRVVFFGFANENDKFNGTEGVIVDWNEQ